MGGAEILMRKVVSGAGRADGLVPSDGRCIGGAELRRGWRDAEGLG
jgi:hypothetical protein